MSFWHILTSLEALHTGRSPYLSDLLQYHEPTRSLRSSSSRQLSAPRRNLTFWSCAFRFSAPRVWNLLPVSIRETKSPPTFRHHLKTHCFQSVYPHSAVHLAWNIFRLGALILLKTLALYKPFTYLLKFVKHFSCSLLCLLSVGWVDDVSSPVWVCC